METKAYKTEENLSFCSITNYSNPLIAYKLSFPKLYGAIMALIETTINGKPKIHKNRKQKIKNKTKQR